MGTDEEGDGSKKERRVGSGLYERYWGKTKLCEINCEHEEIKNG
jgi:hypothetical protein